jgi:hypothetical protein
LPAHRADAAVSAPAIWIAQQSRFLFSRRADAYGFAHTTAIGHIFDVIREKIFQSSHCLVESTLRVKLAVAVCKPLFCWFDRLILDEIHNRLRESIPHIFNVISRDFKAR